ncbi:unnamed protein product [Arabis nemorensis]|uniref:Uncharacterized protein n=1 Tax=Arabis nemorensis TaxID=586526 RepID=A0A565BY97_9BRAS|nr:unnamed protein product [Arabis nemorensis]
MATDEVLVCSALTFRSPPPQHKLIHRHIRLSPSESHQIRRTAPSLRQLSRLLGLPMPWYSPQFPSFSRDIDEISAYSGLTFRRPVQPSARSTLDRQDMLFHSHILRSPPDSSLLTVLISDSSPCMSRRIRCPSPPSFLWYELSIGWAWPIRNLSLKRSVSMPSKPTLCAVFVLCIFVNLNLAYTSSRMRKVKMELAGKVTMLTGDFFAEKALVPSIATTLLNHPA